jgi:hypothetical protein
VCCNEPDGNCLTVFVPLILCCSRFCRPLCGRAEPRARPLILPDCVGIMMLRHQGLVALA